MKQTKKVLVVLAILGFAVVAFAAEKVLYGEGRYQSRELTDLPAFTAVDVRGDAQVSFLQRADQSVTVSGLANLVTTVDAIPEYISKKSLAVFKKYGVYSKEELKARYDVKLGSYYKRINIEALTMVEMVKRGYTGAVVDFEKDLTAMLVQKQSLGMDVKDNFEKRLLEKVSTLSNELAKRTDALYLQAGV